MLRYYFCQRTRLGDVVVFENRQPVTAAKFIINSSLFILLLGIIRRLKLKPNSEQKAENIFVAPPYCQTACCAFVLLMMQYSLELTAMLLNQIESSHITHIARQSQIFASTFYIIHIKFYNSSVTINFTCF